MLNTEVLKMFVDIKYLWLKGKTSNLKWEKRFINLELLTYHVVFKKDPDMCLNSITLSIYYAKYTKTNAPTNFHVFNRI